MVKNNLEEFVKFLGYVNEDELLVIFIVIVIYMSLFEGFGLPVLEGMQYGCSTIASNISSIPEITGKSAILINPYDVDEIYSKLLTIHQDENLRNHLAKKSLSQTSKFDWEKSTNQLIDLYASII